MRALKLDERAVLKLTGNDCKGFLQGLITNDIKKLQIGGILYTALLTPQGKYLFDFFLYQTENAFFLDCERTQIPTLLQKLMLYKLRADVAIEDKSDSMTIYALFDGTADDAIICCTDPRAEGMGHRALFDSNTPPKASALSRDTYEHTRLIKGIPDGSRDMEANKTFILEANLDHFNGISFTKGCYVGQEMTARMMHRTTRKKLLLPIKIEGGSPPSGTGIQTSSGKTAGDIRSHFKDIALAMIRLEYQNDDLLTDGKKVMLLNQE